MIIWQDAVLTAGSVIFLLALFPSLLNKKAKPAILTSSLTGSVLLVYAVVYASLSLWFSVTTTVVTAILWFILAMQKYKQDREGHES